MHWLSTLETLAVSENARITLVSDVGWPRASWKQRGRHIETVESDRAEGLQHAAVALIRRLGYGNLPTPENLRLLMTPGQRIRFARLIEEIQALKREIVSRTPIVEVEPDLALPSSLSRDRVTR